MQNAETIREVLDLWAENARKGRLDVILSHHEFQGHKGVKGVSR